MKVIGIDPGVSTGFAQWDTTTRKLERVESMSIIRAMQTVEAVYLSGNFGIVIVEDARLRKFGFGRADLAQDRSGAGIREGVGSVKRDSSIWEEFLSSTGIPYVMRKPRGTKKDAAEFRRLTGWAGPSNEHSRDAGMTVIGLNDGDVRGALQRRSFERELEGQKAKVKAEALHRRAKP